MLDRWWSSLIEPLFTPPDAGPARQELSGLTRAEVAQQIAQGYWRVFTNELSAQLNTYLSVRLTHHLQDVTWVDHKSAKPQVPLEPPRLDLTNLPHWRAHLAEWMRGPLPSCVVDSSLTVVTAQAWAPEHLLPDPDEADILTSLTIIPERPSSGGNQLVVTYTLHTPGSVSVESTLSTRYGCILATSQLLMTEADELKLSHMQYNAAGAAVVNQQWSYDGHRGSLEQTEVVCGCNTTASTVWTQDQQHLFFLRTCRTQASGPPHTTDHSGFSVRIDTETVAVTSNTNGGSTQFTSCLIPLVASHPEHTKSAPQDRLDCSSRPVPTSTLEALWFLAHLDPTARLAGCLPHAGQNRHSTMPTISATAPGTLPTHRSGLGLRRGPATWSTPPGAVPPSSR